MASSNVPTRSLLEIALGFVGALLVVPLAFKLVGGLARASLSLFGSLFRFSTTRRLMADALLTGLSALLLREDVLDRLFGRSGRTGDGLFKPTVESRRDG